MNKYKILCIGFALAACCYIVVTINRILNTGEGILSILSSVLLAAGFLCLSSGFYKMSKKSDNDTK